ncbi:DUF2069 domain-containing protein [Aliidiomarina taiwanensis]|uniref:DUF2069 domain-containing protein n=1 Tax=Aliidiomarina taiwanensis TaxID=946228 RepID=A0A432XA84_9GAMM|nr:DUF2069 domain-containing protein [Aliidiomarina taiwanensis]RUO44325.1 DUF2069 domain-containing protein [Aliidiomarina taiwanensis]
MKLPTHSGFYRKLTLVCYLPLILFVVLWQTVLAPSEFISLPLAFVLFVLPLLLPLYGILKGNPYTHAWANFILMLYFLHGFTTIYTLWERRYLPLIELLLTTGAFIGATYYARYKGRELGLGLKKKQVGNAGKMPD